MRKFIQCMAILAMLYLGACKVTVPNADGTPPTTEIKVVENKKVLHTFKTGDAQLVIALKPGVVYDLIIDGQDQGGVAKVRSDVTGVNFKGGNETTATQNNARDRRILTQTLDPMKNGDLVTVTTLVEDFKGNKDTSSEPQIIITVGQVQPTVTLTASKTRLTEGDTFKLSWTSSKAKELKFTSPSGNSITIPKTQYAKGSLIQTATKANSRYVLQATSITGAKTNSSPVALTIATKKQCKLVRKSDYEVAVIETVNGREITRHKAGYNNTSGNVVNKLFVAKVATTNDKKRGYAQMLGQTSSIVNNHTTATYNDYFDIYDLTQCTRPFRTVNFVLERGTNAPRGSIGIQQITKNNHLLVQWISGIPSTSPTPLKQAHGFSVIDLNKNSSSRLPEGNYDFGSESLFITKAGAFFLNGAQNKVAVIYKSANGSLMVRKVDLTSFRVISDTALNGFTDVSSASVDGNDQLKINGSSNTGGTKSQTISLK